MAFVNVGVDAPFNKSKKALREGVKADPSKVYVYATSPLGKVYNGPVSDMPADVTLQVVGPDPFRARNWYASIKRTPKGITVS